MNREQWMDEGLGLKEELIEYDWNYRLKICSNCDLIQKTIRKCHIPQEGKIRIIKGKQVHETHCKHMTKARTQKFRSKIMSFLNMGLRSYEGI